MAQHPEWFSVREAAPYLSVNVSTLYRLCAARRIRHRRVGVAGGKIVFLKADLDDYIASTTVEVNTLPTQDLAGLKFIRMKGRG